MEGRFRDSYCQATRGLLPSCQPKGLQLGEIVEVPAQRPTHATFISVGRCPQQLSAADIGYAASPPRGVSRPTSISSPIDTGDANWRHRAAPARCLHICQMFLISAWRGTGDAKRPPPRS